jgi:hypothetical protein
VPSGHWKITTLIASLRTIGITARLRARWRRQRRRLPCLCRADPRPDLETGRHCRHGQSALPQSLAGIREAIENQQGQLLYLPSYSPDLNPSEQALAKLKALMRKSAAAKVSGMPPPKASSSSPLTSAGTSCGAQAIQLDRALL